MIQAMKAAGWKPSFWVPVVCVLLTATLAWGAWNTMATTAALPEVEFEEHEKENNIQFNELLKEIQRQRIAIEEKLDDIQEKL